jgi:hypothetical protein
LWLVLFRWFEEATCTNVFRGRPGRSKMTAAKKLCAKGPEAPPAGYSMAHIIPVSCHACRSRARGCALGLWCWANMAVVRLVSASTAWGKRVAGKPLPFVQETLSVDVKGDVGRVSLRAFWISWHSWIPHITHEWYSNLPCEAHTGICITVNRKRRRRSKAREVLLVNNHSPKN